MIIQASKVEVSRKEWDCYSFTPDAIIADVNTGITEILMTTHHPVTAQKRVYEFLESYKKYGFRDSEGDMASTDAINAYYKSNINRWEAYL